MCGLFKLKANSRAEWAKVDAQDYLELHQHNWHVTDEGYWVRHGENNKQHKLHRDIMGLDIGDPRVVDHENGHVDDNRRDNLRIVSRAENNQNVTSRGGTSDYRGVRKYQDGRDKPWQAFGHEDGEEVHIGTYRTEEEAAKAARDWRMSNYEFTNEERGEGVETASVYFLIDPRTGDVRYIGKSVDPVDRYRHHVKPSRREKDTRKAAWIRELFNEDLAPCLFEVEEVTDEVWEEREKWWLEKLSNEPLTNQQAGGEGQTRGRVRSQKVREKLRRHPAGESRGGSSRFPGVSWNEEKGKWVGFITIRGENRYVGQFEDEIECAKAVYEEREKHYDFEYNDSFEEWVERVQNEDENTEESP